jgi:hypothetical protein
MMADRLSPKTMSARSGGSKRGAVALRQARPVIQLKGVILLQICCRLGDTGLLIQLSVPTGSNPGSIYTDRRATGAGRPRQVLAGTTSP